MERHGGRATITSSAGAGTEVELVLEARAMSEPRVLIVDDHQLFRAGVRSELDPLLEVVGEASGVEEAVRGDPPSSSRRSCCSTCTCRTAAGSR